MRPVLSSTFPQGFGITKIFGQSTSGSGGKIGLKIKQTHTHTHRKTIRLLDRIGPVGGFDEEEKNKIIDF